MVAIRSEIREIGRTNGWPMPGPETLCEYPEGVPHAFTELQSRFQDVESAWTLFDPSLRNTGRVDLAVLDSFPDLRGIYAQFLAAQDGDNVLYMTQLAGVTIERNLLRTALELYESLLPPLSRDGFVHAIMVQDWKMDFQRHIFHVLNRRRAEERRFGK